MARRWHFRERRKIRGRFLVISASELHSVRGRLLRYALRKLRADLHPVRRKPRLTGDPGATGTFLWCRGKMVLLRTYRPICRDRNALRLHFELWAFSGSFDSASLATLGSASLKMTWWEVFNTGRADSTRAASSFWQPTFPSAFRPLTLRPSGGFLHRAPQKLLYF
jgi:hypothetical protein